MKDYEVIHIEGASTNNLKDVTIDIPCNQLVVITGVSGSGKSSLAFDTLYIEGRRRYVESLKSYTRSFLGQLPKPPVRRIENLPPTVAIQQKRFSSNPRSTVGTITEILDYLRLLYAQIGHTISPITGNEVQRHTPNDVVQYIESLPENSKIYILAPTSLSSLDELERQQENWRNKGYARVFFKGKVYSVLDALPFHDDTDLRGLYLLIDRVVTRRDRASVNRYTDSVQTAMRESGGYCSICLLKSDTEQELKHFSMYFEEGDVKFTTPTVHFFDFNNPLGQCPRCKGLGYVSGIDEDLVIPNKGLSIYEGAIACWHGQQMNVYQQQLVNNAHKFNFPIHTPFYKLSAEEKLLLWRGNEYFMGLDPFFQMLNSSKSYKIQDRYLLARFQGKSICPECGGDRLKRETDYVKINGLTISDVCKLSINDVLDWLHTIQLTPAEKEATKILFEELDNRLDYLVKVGLTYLTLARQSSTLSGGESQRLMLSKLLSNSLVGSLYVLDEPSIGLHPRDTERLIGVLQALRDQGNTIVVVEHDEDIMAASDYLIQMGPKAGQGGGEVVYKGKPNVLPKIALPTPLRRPINHFITLNHVIENNLKDISVRFPLQTLTVISGVSGSGKSTLIQDVLYPTLVQYFESVKEETASGTRKPLEGDLHLIDEVVLIDQHILGMSSRSNPATYTKVYDDIRKLYAGLPLAKQLGFTPSHFSFNTPGGRCEYCKGEGTITFEMQFLSDIVLTCEHCHGKRFKKDILDIHYKGRSIDDVLQMTVDEAIDFFSSDKKNHSLVERLQPLHDVGIGYIKLGQPLNDLSGGECQRLKIASFMKEKSNKHLLFLFDEPTTGLSHSDVNTLLKAFDRLIQFGHSLIVIEHNPVVLWGADHIIDLGPDSGDNGGQVVFTGTPEQLIQCTKGYTGKYLKEYVSRRQTG